MLDRNEINIYETSVCTYHNHQNKNSEYISLLTKTK